MKARALAVARRHPKAPAPRPLTIDEWATISAIRSTPEYTFVGSERQTAERLAARGLLRRRTKHRYGVTRAGTSAFEATSF